MALDPLLDASWAIKIHLATVLPAFAIGTWLIFFSTKGARFHRRLGYVYLTLMTVTAVAAVFIHEANPGGFLGLSPIHLFVPITLVGVGFALRGAWTHNVPMHRGAMIGVYIGGMLIAGGLTFIPGRLMYEMFFG